MGYWPIMKITVFLTTIAVALAALCNTVEYPYKGQNISLPIKPAAGQINSNNITLPAPNVAGTISIVDGCTFKVTNFTFSKIGPFANSDIVWYGVANTNKTLGLQISDDPILGSRTRSESTYKLTTAAGREYSFADFQLFEIFDITNNIVLALAELPAAVPVATTTSAAPVAAAPTAAVAAATSGVVGNAGLGFVGFFGLMLLL